MTERQKNILFNSVVVLAILLSIGFTFYKTVIKQDFEIIDTSEEEVDADDEGVSEGDVVETGGEELSTTTVISTEDSE